MIERTARCLKTGGSLICRATKNPFRSRRCLHSAFWSHGAGNIDLPSWWIFFLQTTDSDKEYQSSGKAHLSGEKVSGAIRDIFLDFLYPVQTLALIRRLKRSTSAHQHASQSLKHYCRNYTSIAENVIAGVKAAGSGATADTSARSEARRTVEDIREDLDGILSNQNQREFHDQLWRSYQDLLERSENLSQNDLTKMLRFLGKTKRFVDLERLLALFESIPVQQRQAIHYSYAVSAALSLKDPGTAIAVHDEARRRIRGSIGTSAILAYTVQHRKWQEAVHIWYPYWAHKLAYYAMPELWTKVDSLPLSRLMDRAASAAEFAISATENLGYDGAAAQREFALEMVRRLVKKQGTAFDIHRHWNMVEKVRMLDASDLTIPKQALYQLLSIESREHENQALHLYRVLREDSKFSPTRELLTAITERVVSQKGNLDTLMLIDDWKKYHGALPTRLAISIIRVLAQNGELEATEKLFRDFVFEHGVPKSPDMYFAMLHVFNRRADTTGIVRMWDELQKTYNFKPDVKAWNLVISTFTRVGDLDGALTWLQKMRDEGVKLSSRTFFSLMSLYGKRGDRNAVEDLFRLAKAENIEQTILMIDTLVTANIQDERLDEAEQLVVEATKMPLEGSRSFMWNALLNAHAFRKDVIKVSALHRRMQESGVAADNMTYAALMTALAVLKQPDAAAKIMKTVMPRAKVMPTTIHYAILMGGYLATKQYDKVFNLYQDMLHEKLTPTMSTQNVLLRAAAAVDRKSQDLKGESDDKIAYTRAQQTFEHALANLDPMELAASEPRKFVSGRPINEAFSSTYFEYLIFLYGSNAAFNKVSDLYDVYMKTVPKYTSQNLEASPPVRLLSALMVTHIRDKNYEEVDRCWSLALSKAQQLAHDPTLSDNSKPASVLHSQRFILSLPLSHYIAALQTQDRRSDLLATVSGLQNLGFELTSPNWNAYIRALASSSHSSQQAYAFQLCEKELMPYWPGWKFFRDPRYMKTSRFQPISRATHLIPQKRMPAYNTLVELARAYLLAKKRRGREPSVRDLTAMAPMTVDAVVNMPRLEDAAQTLILRGGEGRSEGSGG